MPKLSGLKGSEVEQRGGGGALDRRVGMRHQVWQDHTAGAGKVALEACVHMCAQLTWSDSTALKRAQPWVYRAFLSQGLGEGGEVEAV